MTMLVRLVLALCLAGAAVLSGCGGGQQAAPMRDQQAAQVIADAGQAISSFIALAQEERCTDIRNRLFLIDGKQVFWDRAGKCGDQAYAQTLYGATPAQVLCSLSDSIAGPRTFCADDKSRSLFETIQKNLDKADLGLAGHKVEQVAFLPKPGSAIPFQTVAQDQVSGVKVATRMVVTDAATLHRLWNEHGSGRSTPGAAPKVDFGHQMLLAVFSGQQGNGCRAMSVVRVGSEGGRIVVGYAERELPGVPACAAAASSPMHMVVVERFTAPVEFIAAKAGALPFRTLDQTTRSAIGDARNVVVRDHASWAALWAQHAGAAAPLPEVDFGKQMVLGVFLGTQQNGCYSTTIKQLAQFGNKLSVLHADSVPSPGVLCTLALTRPAHLVVVDRTEGVVDFATELIPMK